MSGRIVDPTRQGGQQPPAPRTLGQPEMSFAAAHEYLDGMAWRKVRTRSHRALEAMAGEIDRLQAEMAGNFELATREARAWTEAYQDAANEAERLRAERDKLIAAIPEIIRCACSLGAACTRDNHGWFPCCISRLALVRLGIIPASMPAAEEDGGA